jgi:hypothetical protein
MCLRKSKLADRMVVKIPIEAKRAGIHKPFEEIYSQFALVVIELKATERKI